MLTWIVIFGLTDVAFAENKPISANAFLQVVQHAIAIGLSDNRSVVLTPNTPTRIGAGFGYDGIGLDASTAMGTASDEQEKTEYFDFSASYYSTHWGIEGFLGNYRGMIASYDFDDSGFENNQTFVDFVSKGYLVNLHYVPFGNELSFRAIFDHSEQQTEFAWSPVAMISYEYTEMEAKNGLFPERMNVVASDDFRSGSFRSLGLQVGGAVAWPFAGGFNLMGSLLMGSAYQQQRYQTLETQFEGGSPTLKTTLKGGIGYNSPYLFYGLNMSHNMNRFAVDTSTLTQNLSLVTIYCGTRFGPARPVSLSDSVVSYQN